MKPIKQLKKMGLIPKDKQHKELMKLFLVISTVLLVLLMTSCTTVSHHQKEYRCSDNCNKIIDKLQNYEMKTNHERWLFRNLFKKEDDATPTVNNP